MRRSCLKHLLNHCCPSSCKGRDKDGNSVDFSNVDLCARSWKSLVSTPMEINVVSATRRCLARSRRRSWRRSSCSPPRPSTAHLTASWREGSSIGLSWLTSCWWATRRGGTSSPSSSPWRARTSQSFAWRKPARTTVKLNSGTFTTRPVAGNPGNL